MAMRYDVRTGMVVPDEGDPRIPGWRMPDQSRYRYDLRIGDVERDAAMAALQEHFAAGRLTFDELTDRIDGALTAKTQGQIDALMADLPRIPPAPAKKEPGGIEDMSDAGRYLVLLLLLFALAAWLLMMAWMYSHSYSYPTGG
jgi:hypothetical protein